MFSLKLKLLTLIIYLTTIFLILLISKPFVSSQEETSPPLIDEPKSINLALILKHQETLKADCSKLYDEQVKQLKELLSLNNDENSSLHLPTPLPVKIPAVCMYLIEQDNNLENNKLDLVNWIFNEDQLLQAKAAGNESSMNKRETAIINDNELLQDFLYEPTRLNETETTGNSSSSNSQSDVNELILEENIEKIVNSEEFKNVIANNPTVKLEISMNLSPVILIPGLLGSRLQAKTDKKQKVNIFCSKQQDWTDMWLSLRKLLPLAVDCWLDNVRLDFDPETGLSKQPEGIQVRVPNFGSVESVRYLDLNQPKVTSYMAPLIDRYEQIGYIPDYNLLAAPYDFRLAPQQLMNYFKGLRNLIEKAHSRAYKAKTPENRKVTLVCHSMGCTHLLIFLRLQSPAWRQSHIKKVIALSSPWGGAIKAVKALVVGDQLELPLVSEAKMRKLARTYPSIAYLLPQAEVFSQTNKHQIGNASDQILVETPTKIYHLSEMKQLLTDLKLDNQWKWFEESASLIKPFEPLPDVKVDCIHSINTATPQSLIFKDQKDFPNGQYTLIKGDGDGTVNLESLLVCAKWATKMPDKVTHKIIMNTNHIGVLSHQKTLNHITNEAFL